MMADSAWMVMSWLTLTVVRDVAGSVICLSAGVGDPTGTRYWMLTFAATPLGLAMRISSSKNPVEPSARYQVL